jgi:ABC-type uncharacterized transport system permease subunit
MGEPPTTGELSLLIAAIAVFVIGGVASLLRVRSNPQRDPTGRRTETLRVFAKVSLYLGTLLTIGVLNWHCLLRGRQPLEDNFGASLCLAILLALFVAYTQRAHPLRGLEFFIMPVVILLLVAAAVFGKTQPHNYHVTTLAIVHVVSTIGGFAAFAIGGAAGGMYLFANRRLRQKKPLPKGYGSLERLEQLTLISVTLGFALLTVGLIIGFFLIWHPGDSNSKSPQWTKVAMT